MVAADPDLIFLADSLYGESAETVAARPGWAVLGAVEGGNVYELDSDVASRWGPRIVDFAQAIARLASRPRPSVVNQSAKRRAIASARSRSSGPMTIWSAVRPDFRSVSVTGTTGGTKDFNGAITDGNDGDGSGVVLTNNRGVHAPKAEQSAMTALLMLNERIPELVADQRAADVGHVHAQLVHPPRQGLQFDERPVLGERRHHRGPDTAERGRRGHGGGTSRRDSTGWDGGVNKGETVTVTVSVGTCVEQFVRSQ